MAAALSDSWARPFYAPLDCAALSSAAQALGEGTCPWEEGDNGARAKRGLHMAGHSVDFQANLLVVALAP